MIACDGTMRTYAIRCKSTSSTCSATETSGWYEVEARTDVEVVSEPQQEADEPEGDTGGRAPVNWERPNRRLATVTGRVPDRPRQKASGYG